MAAQYLQISHKWRDLAPKAPVNSNLRQLAAVLRLAGDRSRLLLALLLVAGTVPLDLQRLYTQQRVS